MKNLQERKKNIRLIVTDLDDTVLRPDNSVSAYTASVFERCRKKGILTAIATARLDISAKAEAQSLRPQIRIVSNGGMVLAEDRTLFFHGMGIGTTNRLLESLLQAGAQSIVTGCKNISYWNSGRISTSRTLRDAVYHSYAEPLTEQACQILFTLDDKMKVRHLQELFPELSWISYRNGRHAVLCSGASKAAALLETAAFYGIAPKETAAFGDDEGDREMMRLSGLSVAVENAIACVRQEADEIAESNAEDGVARYIEREILGGP